MNSGPPVRETAEIPEAVTLDETPGADLCRLLFTFPTCLGVYLMKNAAGKMHGIFEKFISYIFVKLLIVELQYAYRLYKFRSHRKLLGLFNCQLIAGLHT